MWIGVCVLYLLSSAHALSLSVFFVSHVVTVWCDALDARVDGCVAIDADKLIVTKYTTNCTLCDGPIGLRRSGFTGDVTASWNWRLGKIDPRANL